MKPDLWSEHNTKILQSIYALNPEGSLKFAYNVIARTISEISHRQCENELLQFICPLFEEADFIFELSNNLLHIACENKWELAITLPTAKRSYTARELVEKIGLYKFLN